MSLGIKNELIALGMIVTGTRFLNIGFQPDSVDTPEKQQISVYEAIADIVRATVPSKGKCLEICAGFGDGLKIVGAEGCASVRGVDGGWVVSTLARLRGRAVRRGSVEKLSYGNGIFDHVYGVECLICLDDPAAGLSEIHRILRPGGILTIAEFRLSRIARARLKLEKMAQDAGLDLIEVYDETERARRSVLENAAIRMQRTDRIPRPFRKWAREMAAVPGTKRYDEWANGHRCYYIAQFRKPE